MTRKTNEEQDRAAGGDRMRKVKHPDGIVATASVAVRTTSRGYQLWGYLRFKTSGKTMNCYIGKVSAETIDKSLAIGWRMAREKNVLEQAGWSWLVPSTINTGTTSKKQPTANAAKPARQAKKLTT